MSKSENLITVSNYITSHSFVFFFFILFAQIISIIVKNDEGWLAGQHSLVSQLRRVWVSEAFQERHRKDNMAATNWKEPKLLAYCLLSYCKYVHSFKL